MRRGKEITICQRQKIEGRYTESRYPDPITDESRARGIVRRRLDEVLEARAVASEVKEVWQ